MSLARGGFESLTEEGCIERLPVEGAIPDWLCGALLLGFHGAYFGA